MVFQRHGDTINVENAKLLGESIQMPFSRKVAPSRFLKGAMSERMASWNQQDTSERGIPSDDLVTLYEEWGKAGYGILLTGNVMVHPEHLEAPGNPILYALHETPERIEQFRKLAAAGKTQGSLMIMQASHPGRQVWKFVNPDPVGASDIQLADRMGTSFGKPIPLDKSGIREIVNQFAYAAEVAHRTGFDGIQIHAAHGYLLAQFLSQTTNNRTDEYGGCIENRMRIIVEITEAIHTRVPDPAFVVGFKINSVEFQAKGFQPEEAAELCNLLEALDIDFVELSGGTYEELRFKPTGLAPRESTVKREAFFSSFAQQITPRLHKTVVYVTGGFRSAVAMAEAVRSGACAGIGLARPAASDPTLPNEIIQGKVTGATELKLPPEDFGLASLATGTQMESIARGEHVVDLSDPKEVVRFEDAVRRYQQQKTEDLENGVINPRLFCFAASE